MVFHTKATSTPLGNGQWRLEVDLVYEGARDWFMVPTGFLHDFASVPRIVWPLVGPVGNHAEAAVLHDWLYQAQPCSRADADGIFSRCLQEAGLSWWKRRAMFRAVRLFGWRYWNRNRPRDPGPG